MHFNFKRITAVVLAFALTFSLLITVFANTFTVTFHANGGTGALSPESREIPAGQRLTGTYAPPAAGSQVTRSGYVLAQTPEWFTNASGTGTAWNLNTDIISKDENLYLNWRRLWPVTLEYGQVETEHIINPNPVTFSRHSITYTNEVANGEALAGYAAHPGSQINNPVSIDSITVSTANAPRTLGLLFDGWYTDPDFTNAANLLNPVTSALNLFAKWKPANNVYFDLNYDIFPLTEKYDEELEEWVPDEKPLADAIYDEDKDSYFMPVLKTTTTKGQIAAQVLDDTRIPPYMRPADPVRTAAGWNFIGWYDHPTIPVNRWDRDANNTLTWTNRVPVENNLTLYAHWERPINVTFDFNFGVTSPKLELAAAQKPLSGKGIHVNNRPANATNPTGIYRKPSVGACPHWDTVCESSATCKETEALPVNGNRHGNEWSLEGWYTTPGGPEDGEKWIFNTGYAPNEVVGTLVGSEDLTLYAHWVESYEVTYDIGQVDPASLNTPSFYSPFRYIAPPGKTIETTDTFINVLPYQLSLNSFIAKKHIFVGWFKDSPAFKNQWVTTGTTPDVLTKDTTLYAGWLANVDGTVDSGTAANEIIFDWNFDPDSPTTVTSQLNSRLVPQGGTGKDLYFNNVKSTVPPSVYRTGYNFEGWFTDKKGTAPWNSDNIVADGTIVYAKWSQRITVEFYVLDEHTIYGSSPLRENPAGSGRISNIQLNSGQTVSNPINDSNRNAVIFGYTIESWCFHDYDCGKNADCAWDFSKPIQVTHEENDALFMRLYVNVIESVVIFYNVNWPEGSGTHFMDGWLPDFAEFYNMEKLKKFSDIKGGWLATPVTVPGGPSTGTRVNQMRPGDTLISPPTELNETATRENNVNVPIIGAPPDDLPYQFTGWYRTKETADNNDQNGLFKFGAGQNTITEDIVLFAGWRSSYAVTFNANLPNGIIQQVDVPDPIYVQPPGGRITNPTPDDRPENQPQLTGYAFDGWYKTKAAADALDPNGLFKFQSGATGDVVNQNTTLYAGWVEARLISFNLGPGVPGIPPQARMVGLGRLVPPPSLVTRGEGYDFVGWYTSPNDSLSLNPGAKWDLDNDKVIGQMTLYAGWIEVHTVSFDINFTPTSQVINPQLVWNGSGNKAGLFSERTHVKRVPAPTRSGSTFVGWYTQPVVNIDTMSPWIFTENIVTSDTVLYAGWIDGEDVNPLLIISDELMAAAEIASINNVITFDVDMGNYNTIPRFTANIIKNKYITLNLNLGKYILHISGENITAADRDYNLSVNIEFGTEPWILASALKNPVSQKFDDERERPIWQIIISNEINSISKAITLLPGDENNYDGVWEYGILISRIGLRFTDMKNAKLENNGNITFTLSLAMDGGNDFIILLNDEPSSVVLCPDCNFPEEDCVCPPKCLNCKKILESCTCCPAEGCNETTHCDFYCQAHNIRVCQTDDYCNCCQICSYDPCICCPAGCGKTTAECLVVCLEHDPPLRECQEPCGHVCPICDENPPCVLTCNNEDCQNRDCQGACTECCPRCGQNPENCDCCPGEGCNRYKACDFICNQCKKRTCEQELPCPVVCSKCHKLICEQALPCATVCTVCGRLSCEEICSCITDCDNCGKSQQYCTCCPAGCNRKTHCKIVCQTCSRRTCEAKCDCPTLDCISGVRNQPCQKFACDLCNPNGNTHKHLGDTNGDGKMDIFDCLEILKFLIKMDCTITKGGANITKTQAEKAAVISPNGFKEGKPTIFCVLEILKYMIKMPSTEVKGDNVGVIPK